MTNLTDSLKNLNISNYAYEAEMRSDLNYINNYKHEVIAGFLSIGAKQGWTVFEKGETHDTGFRFTRGMYRKFCKQNAMRLGDYADILEKTNQAFNLSLIQEQNPAKCPRAVIDSSISGWLQHDVSRTFGWVSMQSNQKGPFFEVLINSTMTSINNPYCYPFQATIIPNLSAANNRWKQLDAVKKMDGDIAHPIFYNSAHNLSIDDFLLKYRSEHKKDPGEKSYRLLKALEFLNTVKMKAQSSGNCWMKQNKRQVLVQLFIQTVTVRPEMDNSQAWITAKMLYRKWKKFTREEIKEMIKGSGVSRDLASIAMIQMKEHPL